MTLSKVGSHFSNRDSAATDGEVERCVAPKFMVDIGRFLRRSRLRLSRSLAQVINDQFRNDEAKAHRQNNRDGSHAVGGCRQR